MHLCRIVGVAWVGAVVTVQVVCMVKLKLSFAVVEGCGTRIVTVMFNREREERRGEERDPNNPIDLN